MTRTNQTNRPETCTQVKFSSIIFDFILMIVGTGLFVSTIFSQPSYDGEKTLRITIITVSAMMMFGGLLPLSSYIFRSNKSKEFWSASTGDLGGCLTAISCTYGFSMFIPLVLGVHSKEMNFFTQIVMFTLAIELSLYAIGLLKSGIIKKL